MFLDYFGFTVIRPYLFVKNKSIINQLESVLKSAVTVFWNESRVRDGNGKPAATLLAERGLAVYCLTAAGRARPKETLVFLATSATF
jgi:hypothetical protein